MDRLIFRLLKKGTLQLFLIITGFLLIPSDLLGSHMIGADINYQYLGKKRYLITAKFYRDCSGISFSGPTFTFIPGRPTLNCTSFTMTKFKRISIKDITPICQSQSIPCSPANTGGTAPGFEEHVYVDTVDLTQAPYSGYINSTGCCVFSIFAGQCCRKNSITTGPSGWDFWCSCKINFCNINKSETKADNGAIFNTTPIMHAILNAPFIQSFGVSDPDGDSVKVKLIPALATTNIGSSVQYSNPFTFQTPMTCYCVPGNTIKCTPNPNANPPLGFYLDSQSGNMIFTPKMQNEIGVVAVEATSYRYIQGQWLEVGRVSRDLTLFVKDLAESNAPPYFVAQNNYSLRDRDSACYDFYIYDTLAKNQSMPDTLKYQWSQLPPNTKISETNIKNGKKITLCLYPNFKDTAVHTYFPTLLINDQNCTKTLSVSYSFNLRINPYDTTITRLKPGICGDLFISSRAINPKSAVTWKYIITDSIGDTLYKLNGAQHRILHLKKGKYFITQIAENTTHDYVPVTFNYNFIPIFKSYNSIADKTMCSSESATFDIAKPDFIVKGNYSWKTDGTLSSTTGPRLNIVRPKADVNITVFASDTSGCIINDTFKITSKPAPVVNFTTNPTIADKSFPQFITQNNSTSFANDTLKYFWNFGMGSGTDTSTKKQPTIIYPNQVGSYVCTLIAKSKNGCSDTARQTLLVTDSTASVHRFMAEGNEFAISNTLLVTGKDIKNIQKAAFDASGKMVFSATHNSETTLPAGIYFIRLNIELSNGKKISLGKKMVIE